MSGASDILRERAEHPFDAGMAAEWHAVAALMEACVTQRPGYFRCKVCGAQGTSKDYPLVRTHMGDCALAALERAIPGER